MTVNEQLLAYAEQLFAPEDAALHDIRAMQERAGLPDIAISPYEGQILAVLLTAIGARRVLEIGTLGGYSGVWMARALPEGGVLTTIEAHPKHAEAARRAFERAGVTQRVELIVGRALEVLPTLGAGFDAIFVDADKEPLEQYYGHAMRLLRRGGWLLCDNAFLNGRVTDPRDVAADVSGVRAFNRLAAGDPRLVAAVVPVRDGLVAGVKVAE
jgi:predicted O-methyltransferase YrrM